MPYCIASLLQPVLRLTQLVHGTSQSQIRKAHAGMANRTWYPRLWSRMAYKPVPWKITLWSVLYLVKLNTNKDVQSLPPFLHLSSV